MTALAHPKKSNLPLDPSKEIPSMARFAPSRPRLPVLILALAFVFAAFVPVAEGAPAAAPAWTLNALSYPTNFSAGSSGSFAEGPGYLIRAANIGGAPTSGLFTVTDTIPAGVTAVSAQAVDNENLTVPCTVTARLVTCTDSETLQAAGFLKIRVTVNVDASPPATSLVNQVTVTGGDTAVPATAAVATEVSSALPAFGFLPGTDGFHGSISEADGSPSTQAGSHPYQLTVGMAFPSFSEFFLRPAGGGVRDIAADLPRGMAVNPTATPVRCTEAQLEDRSANANGAEGNGFHCPQASQIGLVALSFGETTATTGNFALYNMVTPPGAPAEFGFVGPTNIFLHIRGRLRSNGEYQLAAEGNDLLAKVPVLGVDVTLWGDPSDESHDAARGECLQARGGSCPIERESTAFVTMPSACSGPLTTTARADGWVEPGRFDKRSYASADLQGNPVGVGACGSLAFQPSITAQPTTARADSPTGLAFNLHVPQNENYEQLATANLKDARVTLPPGMVVNPSAANGLAACSEAQIGREADVEEELRFSETPQSCPDASKLGTVEVSTPLLDHKLAGAIYLAAPHQNPFGSLLGLYLAVEDEQTDIVAKLAGKVEPNPQTGQLTATFTNNPELPLEDVTLHFSGGERAPLTTPTACGQFSAGSDLTPWSSPQGADTAPSSPPFTVATAPPGGACAPEPQLPHQPSFEAGTLAPLAGAYSPFVLKLARADGTQRITAIDTTLPEGLTGKLAGIPYCSNAVIAGAANRTGREELAAASCPAASEIGTVEVGAGAGSEPYYVTGHAYLGGPYKGAPISLAIITPAVAGPFDLGNVVTRVALYVDEYSAQIHAVSDPLPTILQGIPLDVRSIVLKLQRPDFTLNPTSCEPSAILGTAVAPAGATALLSSRFQVGGCSNLSFKPKLRISLKGATRRAGHPALKAVVTYPKKGAYSNIARAQVGLPHSEFLDQSNLENVCTQANLKADTCPKKSIYGHAKAWTPLLAEPLEGPVYLGVGFGYKLPALVADLNGQIRILLKGRIDTTKHKGIRNTFEAVPDAPVSRFVLSMKGGKKYGLLENSEDTCRKVQRASARFIAQNGRAEQLRPRIANSCPNKKHHAKHHRQKKGKKQTSERSGNAGR